MVNPFGLLHDKVAVVHFLSESNLDAPTIGGVLAEVVVRHTLSEGDCNCLLHWTRVGQVLRVHDVAVRVA